MTLQELQQQALQLPLNERSRLAEFILASIFEEWETHLISDPNVLGGETVFPNSRLSVRRVGTMLERGESPEDIKEDYPYLTEEDIKFAQRYVRAYPSVEQPTKG